MKRIVLGLVLGSVMGVVNARDLGQWENTRSRRSASGIKR